MRNYRSSESTRHHGQDRFVPRDYECDMRVLIYRRGLRCEVSPVSAAPQSVKRNPARKRSRSTANSQLSSAFSSSLLWSTYVAWTGEHTSVCCLLCACAYICVRECIARDRMRVLPAGIIAPLFAQLRDIIAGFLSLRRYARQSGAIRCCTRFFTRIVILSIDVLRIKITESRPKGIIIFFIAIIFPRSTAIVNDRLKINGRCDISK